MGREVRRVPADWQHPKLADGSYKPLLGRTYSQVAAEWQEEERQWAAGFRSTFEFNGKTLVKRWTPKEERHTSSYEEYAGAPPKEKDYMPNWPSDQRTHWQMYEDTTEGTPISPVFETPEALARWLADSGASALGDMTATYEQWLEVIKKRSTPAGFTIGPDGMKSGVEAASE